MGVVLAIRRSFKHLLPQPSGSLRKFIRKWYAVGFFYVLGLYTGMYLHPADPQGVTYLFLACMVVLGLAKWWSKASANPPER